MAKTMQVRLETLRRAREITGSSTLLAARLAVSSRTADAWLSGRQPIPQDIFELAAEIVLVDDMARAAGDRRREPRAHHVR